MDVQEKEEGDRNDFQLDAPKEGGELNVPEGEDHQSDAPKEGGEDLDIWRGSSVGCTRRRRRR